MIHTVTNVRAGGKPSRDEPPRAAERRRACRRKAHWTERSYEPRPMPEPGSGSCSAQQPARLNPAIPCASPPTPAGTEPWRNLGMTTGVKPVRRRPPARLAERTYNPPRPASAVEDRSETAAVVPPERTVGQRLAPVLVFLAVLAILAAIILPAHLADRG